MRDLSQAFREADPADCRELLSSIVTKIELHFHHEATDGGRERNVFSHGDIFVRPDAGEARSTEPKSSHMFNKGSYFDTFEKTDDLMGRQRAEPLTFCGGAVERQDRPGD